MQETFSHLTAQSKPAKFAAPYESLFKVIWNFVAALSIGLFVLGWPLRFQELLSPSDGIAAGLEKAGVSTTLWTLGMLGTETILMLTCSVLGIMLYFQRRKEVVIFVTSLLLILFGTGILNVLDALIAAYAQFEPVVLFLKACLWSLLLLFFYIFPNGKFEQAWSRWSYAGWLVFTWGWFFFPASLHNPTQIGVFNHEGVFLAYFLWLLSGVYLLYNRSQKSATYEERQQTKWVISGIAGAVLITFLEEIPSTIDHSLVDHSTPGGIDYALISTLIFTMGVLLVPMGIAFSIYRKRLWQIDYLINRSLVHALMGLLILVFSVAVFILLTGVLRSNLDAAIDWLAVLITAVLVAILYRPLNRSVQRLVDRRVFGIQIKYKQNSQVASQVLKAASNWHNTSVGRYKIEKSLHRGKTGWVYSGIEITTGATVAVKFLHPHLALIPEYRKAFVAEAKILSELDHPNIIRLLDYGEEDETTCYIVMEYISDLTLANRLKDGKQLDFQEAKYFLSQLADALDYAHRQGVIHLDIKPSNILLRKDSASPFGFVPILTDFGISKPNNQKPSADFNEVTGTFDYISPEQIIRPNALDSRADIYALGVLAYKMVTGQLPFSANQTAALLIAHIYQPPPNPLSINPDLPAKTAFAILNAMAKEPSQRFENAKGFVEGFA